MPTETQTIIVRTLMPNDSDAVPKEHTFTDPAKANAYIDQWRRNGMLVWIAE